MGDYMAKSVGPDNWRRETDYHSLMSAAKVLTDRVRLKGALAYMKECKAADRALDRMLVSHKKKGRIV